MAYKFQRGAAVASGSFTAEEGLVSSTTISGSTTLQAGGALTVGGLSTLNGGVTTTTATATSIQALNYKANDGTSAFTIADSTGQVTISTNLVANGNTTLGNATTDIIDVQGRFSSSLTPSLNTSFDVGIVGNLWRNVKSQYLSSSADLLVGNAATIANGLTVTAGGATVTAGGLTVTAGGATVTAGGLTVSSGDSSVQKLTVNGDLIVLGNTFSASVGTLLIEDAAIVIGDGSTAFGNGYGLLFGSGSNQWASLQTNTYSATNVLSSSLPIKASSFIGSILSTVNPIGDADGTLVTGVNYGNATVTLTRTWTLPASASLSIGDSVKVKAAAGLSPSVQIIVSGSGAQTIDGETTVALESPYAAIECVYVANNTWRIF